MRNALDHIDYYDVEPSYAEQCQHEDEVSSVFNELYYITGYDSFCQRGMEVFYGDDYEHLVTQQMVAVLSKMTGLQEWKVNNIMLDDLCEVWHNRGVWYSRRNGMWKEFSRDEEDA